MVSATLSQTIAALPVPEVQWRDLTDDELNEIYKEFHDDWGLCEKDGYEEAVIAKFKEKQL